MNIGRAVRAGRWSDEKRTVQDRKKVTKGLYFTCLRRSPHSSDLRQKLCSKWRGRRSHVCQVSKWNFQGLRFYRGSNFQFSYWFLNGPYNSAALLHCLWWIMEFVAFSSLVPCLRHKSKNALLSTYRQLDEHLEIAVEKPTDRGVARCKSGMENRRSWVTGWVCSF